ncbi:MAG: ECF transporter S component [Ndongobacter sp.]|nr:ECF transporter S component [Ndongobacter sp.]
MQNKSFMRSAFGLSITALFLALNVLLSCFGIPFPGGKIFLNDVVICSAAFLLADPLAAFCIGGVGAFIGDFLFFPPWMFISLAVHGIQAAAIAYLSRRLCPQRPEIGSAISFFIGALLMLTGYSIARAYMYGSVAAAVIGLPFEIVQAGIGVVGAWLLCWRLGLVRFFDRVLLRFSR